MSTFGALEAASLVSVNWQSAQAAALEGERDEDGRIRLTLQTGTNESGDFLRVRTEFHVDAGDVEVGATIDAIYALDPPTPEAADDDEAVNEFLASTVLPTIVPYLREVASTLPARFGKLPVPVNPPPPGLKGVVEAND